MFWDNYKIVELGTRVGLDDFVKDEELKSRVKKGIIGLYLDTMNEVKRVIGKGDEDAIWELAKKGIISPDLIQELLDVISIIKNLDKLDDAIIYSMLVRIMENLEQLYIAVTKSQK